MNIEEKGAFQFYYNYMMETGPRLIEAQKTIDEIKKDPVYSRAKKYFLTLKNRGLIKENPTEKNGYKIVLNDK